MSPGDSIQRRNRNNGRLPRLIGAPDSLQKLGSRAGIFPVDHYQFSAALRKPTGGFQWVLADSDANRKLFQCAAQDVHQFVVARDQQTVKCHFWGHAPPPILRPLGPSNKEMSDAFSYPKPLALRHWF